jgi:hypothetical protein
MRAMALVDKARHRLDAPTAITVTAEPVIDTADANPRGDRARIGRHQERLRASGINYLPFGQRR